MIIIQKNGWADTQKYFLPNIFIAEEGRHDQTQHLPGPSSAVYCLKQSAAQRVMCQGQETCTTEMLLHAKVQFVADI